MQYDYLVVGSGLYGAIFFHEVTRKGKSVLVVDKRPHIAGNVYTEKVEGINVHKYGAHIFIQIIRKFRIILLSLRSLIVLLILRLQIIRESFLVCHLTCTHLTRCGVL